MIHKIKITNFVPHIGFSPAVYKKACKNYLVFLTSEGLPASLPALHRSLRSVGPSAAFSEMILHNIAAALLRLRLHLMSEWLYQN